MNREEIITAVRDIIQSIQEDEEDLGAIDPAVPPAFPGGFAEITAADEDGDIGGDASFLYTFTGAGTLTWFQVAANGSDGTLGPN